ncbi:helix-turn-helix transcriptional regulator [Streptomyces sp. NBC_00555]|uniref:helix-turn-helix domain-containing protein n=1 Tax=Streptomyces sp. NBC_00555 TaxID=2903662 RepID=UPI00225A968A|nr:helix-turn-helix transcriptional regulator [Streptomyces sp. NBC_00555]MCX5012174.1 helix-turn-helix transcriptional regulator [Streptomyces sp. NBC_00555]
MRTLREKRGVSRQELGGRTNFSPSAIGAFERGDRAMDAGMIEQVDDLLSGDGLLKVVVPYLEEEGRYAPQFRDFAPIEKKAVSLWVYDTHIVNGLLQTEAYARQVFADHWPPVDAAEIERRLEDRIGRQVLLHRDPAPVLCFVLEESFLRRRVGGEMVWREQLQHLLDCGRLAHVSIQLVPMECEEFVGSVGPMKIAETPEHRMLGYVEGQGQSWVISSREVVSEMIQRHANIRAVALSPRASARRIERLLGER